jgi:hypothetical protein
MLFMEITSVLCITEHKINTVGVTQISCVSSPVYITRVRYKVLTPIHLYMLQTCLESVTFCNI